MIVEETNKNTAFKNQANLKIFFPNTKFPWYFMMYRLISADCDKIYCKRTHFSNVLILANFALE